MIESGGLSFEADKAFTIKFQFPVKHCSCCFLNSSAPEQVNSPEQEEGVIPDSPIMASSLPVTNKLKKRKNIDRIKHVRYAEMPLPKANNSLFSGQSAFEVTSNISNAPLI